MTELYTTIITDLIGTMQGLLALPALTDGSVRDDAQQSATDLARESIKAASQGLSVANYYKK